MGLKILKAKYHLSAIIKKLGYKLIYGNKVSMGKGVTFRKCFSLCVDNNAKVKIGDDCFFNNGCSVNALECVEIGDRCIFGESVKIYDHNHKFRDKTKPMKDQGYTSGKVKIGNDCWIASNVTILKGVTIGSHCVIGANCLIYKDVPDNTIVKNSTEIIMETY